MNISEQTEHSNNDVMQRPFTALVPFPPVYGLLYIMQPKSWGGAQ